MSHPTSLDGEAAARPMTDKPTPAAYPATVIVHWPGQSVSCCDRHAEKLMGMAGAMGFSVTATIAPFDAQCTNCVNEGER